MIEGRQLGWPAWTWISLAHAFEVSLIQLAIVAAGIVVASR